MSEKTKYGLVFASLLLLMLIAIIVSITNRLLDKLTLFLIPAIIDASLLNWEKFHRNRELARFEKIIRRMDRFLSYEKEKRRN